MIAFGFSQPEKVTSSASSSLLDERGVAEVVGREVRDLVHDLAESARAAYFRSFSLTSWIAKTPAFAR